MPALAIAGFLGGAGLWLMWDWLSPLPAHTTEFIREMHRRSGMTLMAMVTVQCAAVGAALVPRRFWLRGVLLPLLVVLGTAAVLWAFGGRERVVRIFTDPAKLFAGMLAPPSALFLVHELAVRRHVGATHSMRVPYAYLLLGVLAGVAIGSAGGRRGMIIGAAMSSTLLMLQYYGLLAAIVMAARRSATAATPGTDEGRKRGPNV